MASSPRIDELRKKFEENPRRYFAPLANEYRKVGEVEQAIAICREHLPQQPGHMSGHIVFGQALYEAKQLDEAKTVFETALSLDPENLIALKHLGDITLAAGDKDAAKGWYKRVLDADPRNEETLAQLALLEGGAKPAASAPVVPASPAAAAAPAKTMPMPAAKPATASSAPTVVMPAMKPPAPPAPAAPLPSLSTAATVPVAVPSAPTPDSPTQEIRLEGLSHGADSPTKVDAGSTSIPATLIMETPHGLSPVAHGDAPAVVPTAGLETTSVGAAEAPPIDSFSLDGLETTSLATPPPVPAADLASVDLDFGAPAPPPAPEPAPGAEAVAAPEIELDMPAAPAAFTPPALAAPEALPSVDLDFSAPSASEAPAPEAAAPEAPPDESGLVDLDIGLVAPAVPAVPEMEAPVPAPESGPFVTETMAELYLQQGHRDEALRVYRALLEQRPGDAGIASKIAQLAGVAPIAALPSAVDESVPPLPGLPPADGPTIRAVLMLIAMRRPGFRPDAEAANGAPTASAEMAAPSFAVETPASPSADSLAALWNGAPPSAEEETAALVLSAAFADLDGAAFGDGALDLAPAAAAAAAAQAAQAAAMAGGAPAAPSSFSFDKFFSQRVTAEHAAQVAKASASGTPVESKEDVAQFTQWLEGLKKR